MWILAVTVLLTTQQSVRTAYPFSFSKRECRDLFPERVGKDSLTEENHHHHHDSAPFIIEPSETIHGVRLGGIQVLVKSNDKWRIQGIMMQARVVGNCNSPKQQQPVGHFETPENHAYLRAANCSDHPFETVTHKRYPMNTDSITVRWFPPEKMTAEIYFVATIVSQRDKFWTGIFSHTVRHKDRPLTPGHPQCSMRSKYIITTKSSPQSSRGHILHSSNLFIWNLLAVLLCAMYYK